MNKIPRCFINTDVILDLLAHRQPHFHFSALIFTFGEMKKLELFTTPTVLVNTFYILRKQLGNEDTKNAIRKIHLILNIIDSSDKSIEQALNSNFNDFKDAVQYYTALNSNINVFLTRNIKDYKDTLIPVQTPEMFLAGKQLI